MDTYSIHINKLINFTSENQINRVLKMNSLFMFKCWCYFSAIISNNNCNYTTEDDKYVITCYKLYPKDSTNVGAKLNGVGKSCTIGMLVNQSLSSKIGFKVLDCQLIPIFTQSAQGELLWPAFVRHPLSSVVCCLSSVNF